MKKFKVINVTEYWSTTKLSRKIEAKLNTLSLDGYEIVSVSVGMNMWYFPTAYITVYKEI
ncbi:hypothetical protein [Chishuiella sp.]|uniref:hypothetical protein n=1 Tax=Chishuiella sp. TaxID=1969467 RepID=UPI0028A6D6CE|nr:hypothetical protein [Chishuiella sp.]